MWTQLEKNCCYVTDKNLKTSTINTLMAGVGTVLVKMQNDAEVPEPA